MTDETKPKGGTVWKVLGIIFIILFILSVLIILRLTSEMNYYQENYIHKCPDGKEQRCESSDAPYNQCKAGEYMICYDERLQSAITCNSAEDKVAKCVSENYNQWVSCADGEEARCIKEGTSCMSCPGDTSLRCLDNGEWGFWTGTYFYTCASNEKAACYDI